MAFKDRWNGWNDDQQIMAGIVLAGLAALVIWIFGGLLTLSFASCDVGTCSDGSCWWGCDCGYFESDSPAYVKYVAVHNSQYDSSSSSGRRRRRSTPSALSAAGGECPSGHVCSGGAFFAQDCAAKDTLCQPGTYCAESGCAECLPCSPGTMCSTEGCAACELCPAGRFSVEGATECSMLCPAGTYGDDEGVCANCPAGRFSDAGAPSVAGCFLCDSINQLSNQCGVVVHKFCPSISGDCVQCSGHSDCTNGTFCNDVGLCDACEDMVSGTGTFNRCDVMGGDCCSASALDQCPGDFDDTECTFCRGDIISCESAFAVGFVWLALVLGISAFSLKRINDSGTASIV
jgi:hypothetical protein